MPPLFFFRPRWSAFAALLALGPAGAAAQGLPDYEKPPVSYSATAPADAIAAIQRRLDAGELK